MSAFRLQRISLLLPLAFAIGCSSQSKDPKERINPGVTPANHPFFPIAAGATHEFGKTLNGEAGPIACESCHPATMAEFSQIDCLSCHGHTEAVTDQLHLEAPPNDAGVEYAYVSRTCLACHAHSDKKDFDHAGITDGCATCHDVGSSFAALPLEGFTHPSMGSTDCHECHKGFTSWKTTTVIVQLASDPSNDLIVNAQVPTWSGLDIATVTPQALVLPMVMNHDTFDLDPQAMSSCANCHLGAAAGAYFPGTMHSSLANLTINQPTHCSSCHTQASPAGFVGPLATKPPRLPASGEMKHDAVAWANGVPTMQPLVPTDCGVCHVAPGQQGAASWSTAASGSLPVFHASLTAAGVAQPASCIDCHANSRPSTLLTSTNSSIPAGLQFDHGDVSAKGDCAGCHVKSAPGFTSWAQALFHAPGSSTPSTCLPCHASARPTSTTGWVNPNYAKAPFNYGPTKIGPNTVEHGAGLDCVTCHANAGTGQWGKDQNWAAGTFTHTATSLAGGTCLTCHLSQRPDLVLGVAQAKAVLPNAFDHSINGAGDCYGCHQATVVANTYATYFNATTGKLPNGDWKDGVQYPGGTWASSGLQTFNVPELTLTRSGPNNLVTAMVPSTGTLTNGMLHTSAQMPAVLSPGPNGQNTGICWHCHTSTGTTVTSFSEGQFHSALKTFSATPGGPIAALPQPTTGCADCHGALPSGVAPGIPANIVQKAGASLISMDHSAQFSAAVVLGGKSVTSVLQVDCSVCHSKAQPAGTAWNDGVFHANIGTAQLKECVGCHYPLLADSAKADVSTPKFSMKHRSITLTTQSCETCHLGALASADTAPPTAARWQLGVLHKNSVKQPAACVDCHAPSLPTASTQSTVTWNFVLGGTPTNGAMWMNHASPNAVGKDCVVCHAADAKQTGSAWSKSDLFHTPVPKVAACNACHGLTNGSTVAGLNNNLPNALTDSSTITSASQSTGVAGAADQISHTDLNVSAKDCIVCHVTPAGGQWTTAKFHANLTASSPLVINGTTARCSNCHLNVKPGPGYTAQDHSTFTSAPGTDDCSKCHSFPGTGTGSAANWLGATGQPTYITVGAFTVPNPPAPAGTTQTGIMSLPHPSTSAGACTACHATSSGGKNAAGYDHASVLIANNCGACHEAGSNLVGTVWNGATTSAAGAGDTRPFTLTSIVATHGGGLTVTYPKHFYPADCAQCHGTPGQNGTTTTGAAYAAAWAFPHDQSAMSNPTTCLMCHTNGIPGAPDGGVADPTNAVSITGLVPRFTATTIAQVSPLLQTLPMNMLHSSTEFPAAANSACTNCHETANSGIYYPGSLHSSLANLNLAQPKTCASCHGKDFPSGFVGPTATNPARTPASGEMRHEAVAWANGAPTASMLVSTNCAQCHVSPSATLQATWAITADGGVVKYHASLGAQPASCLDCHANSRRTDVLTSSTAALPANVQFDHGVSQALGDCQNCHAKSAVSPWSSWTGGQFHLPGSSNPTTCLPCHGDERPTSTTGWKSTTYTKSPFDYVINHGDGLDCATCHRGPGTGTWGSTQNWQNGSFTHSSTSVSNSTCLACHSTQRPDLALGSAGAASAVLPNHFDHSVNGTGDCIGCHQATVVANTYVNYFNPSTGMLPNGDWKNGIEYPGSTLISAPTQFVSFTQTILNRTGALVTSTSTAPGKLYNAMLHTSIEVPAAVSPGPTSSPDSSKCWHCHTHTGTTVTSFSNGQFHSALKTYSATPGGTVSALPQPTARCTDCHAQILNGVSTGLYPPNIVELANSDLQPMDHAAQFTAAVVINGASVTAVDQIDCVVCHNTSGNTGTTWADGIFHANIAGATPKDCVGCHYPLMADAAKADLTSGANYVMKHRSTTLTSQACATCHTSALAAATGATHASTLWKTATLHPNLGTQPAACIECHTVSEPAAGASTQSTVTYSLPLGATSSNGAQWLNHGSTFVAGKDCVSCHAADAKASGSAWSKSDLFHPNATSANTCVNCHGTTNGKGTVIGTNNNLPAGLTNSTLVSSAAGAAMTGIPAGTLAQLTHADVNVTAFDCAVCHTQKGTSTVPGIAGKEWAQASFHSHFNASTPLVMNTTTGRCSNCHLNVKPGTAFTAQAHASFSSTSGTQDCASCHSYPGTGTSSSPNWLGAVGGQPTYLTVGGFSIPQPPAKTATTQTGITNLPHPTVGTGVLCTACHSTTGNSPAIGYDHASSLITANCNACHEAGSTHQGTLWNNATTYASGAGDTRPFTATTVTASKGGDSCTFTNPNHFYPVNCHQCHPTPTGTVKVSTGSTYTTRWKFVHSTGNMSNPSTCNLCHASPANCSK